jgi:hypothetical protein
VEFIVIINFASGHDPAAGMNSVAAYLNQNHHPFRAVGPTAFLGTASVETPASAIGTSIGTNCLQALDEIFVGELTSNQFSH